ncbi:MAG: c-type cytochrome, partial [Verrucomicrobia bacterium]|nr:c-type cytochrome [Verrucomicrobiota bacterium]
SSGYGAEYKDGQMTSEGRVFRVASKSSTPARWQTPKRGKPLAQWTVSELVEDFDGPLPVWRIDAQDELVRRGASVKAALLSMMGTRGLNEARETWTAWTLGRLTPQDRTIDVWFSARAGDSAVSLNLRVQSLRIVAHRIRQAGDGRELPIGVVNTLGSQETRLRFEAVQAIGQVRQRSAVPALLARLASETDAATFYAGWQTLRNLQDVAALKPLLADARAGVRKAALLALLETHALKAPEVEALATDADSSVKELASGWLQKAGVGGQKVLVRGRPLNAAISGANKAGKGATTAEMARIGVARKIQARSGARYSLAAVGLRPGTRPYTDRNYDLKEVPPALLDLDFIQTANNDDGSHGDGWLNFEALMPVRVFVAFDTRAKELPAWLRERFQRTAQTIRADHWTFQLYTREFPAGRVELGGNTDEGQPGGKGNYIVVLEPLPLTPPSGATALDPALATLPQGSRERGEWLFHARGGVGCFNCHRVGERGNSFGPDLAALGDRANAKHIVQSMLEPNAVITEGFNLQTVETADAEYSGILLEESGLNLTLGLATGQRQVIPKPAIKSRKTASTSAMPAYDTLLTPQYVADVTAYLLAQKAGAPDARKSNSPAPERAPSGKFSPLPKADVLRFTEQPDRLVILQGDAMIGEFVFVDAKTRRPFFANLRAPGGIPITRTWPPVEGVDATDHADMHPGVWLGFGKISGQDFWRNKATMKHESFVVAPAWKDGRLEFSTQSSLLAIDGARMAAMRSDFTLTPKGQELHLTWAAAFTPEMDDFYFGDEEEMGLGVRMATPLTEKASGLITSSTGKSTAKATWGQPAEWCDYSGSINGIKTGITVIPDPANVRPSWWHNRDYGVFVANPFGRASMKQGEPSRVEVKRGETHRMKFTVILHAGTVDVPAAAGKLLQELKR